MTDELDQILARINYDPRAELGAADRATLLRPDPIPWPDGLAPKRIGGPAADDEPLPEADVLIVTYTAAEGHALADVLTPGSDTTTWTPYKNGWPALKALIEGGRAPSLFTECAGVWALVQIGDKRVVCVKSDMHPSTDGPKLPMVALWQQMLAQVGPELVITTGTAGGVGANVLLGDVIIANEVQWDCQKQFKHQPWAGDMYRCATEKLYAVQSLVQVNAHHLPESPRPLDVGQGHTITTDFFCFDTADDHYGLRKYDALAEAVEMDDAALGIAVGSSGRRWVSVRNASDPGNLSGASLEAEDKEAASIYQKYGMVTSWGSAIVCWALVAGLGA